jgi:hypothetical protein
MSDWTAQPGSGVEIVGVARLTKGIGFSPDLFDERLVFFGVLARSLKLLPQTVDEGETLAAV